MEGDGMVTVVRGLPDAGLCVTLLDGAKQYTLMPNSVPPQVHQACPIHVYQNYPGYQMYPPDRSHQHHQRCMVPHPHHKTAGTNTYGSFKTQCNTSTQAVDGRYTSTYKTYHCNQVPTSPQIILPEFPPQRAIASREHGNFKVGGDGSRSNASPSPSPTRMRGSLRAASPSSGERGLPLTRHPAEPNPFADSLRKYPHVLSPERSSEVMERLVNYSQIKNLSKHKNLVSSSRSESDRPSGSSHQHKYYAQEDNKHRVVMESPTREITTARPYDYPSCGPEFRKNYDMRFIKDMTKKMRDCIKNSSYPPTPIRGKHEPTTDHHRSGGYSTVQVHTETQAEVPTMSREVSTLPPIKPLVKNVNVAVSFGPRMLSSHSTNQTYRLKATNYRKSTKSNQTINFSEIKLRKSVQTCLSLVEIQHPSEEKVNANRKIQSQHEIRQPSCLEDEVIQLIQNLAHVVDDDRISSVKNDIVKKLKDLHRLDTKERIKDKFKKCITDRLFSDVHIDKIIHKLSDELVTNIKKKQLFANNCETNVFRAELYPFKETYEYYVEAIIMEWLKHLPVTKDVNKNVLHTTANNIKTVILNRRILDNDACLKFDILQIIHDLPMQADDKEIKMYVNRLVTELIDKINDVTVFNDKLKRKCNNSRNVGYFNKLKKPTDDEIRDFVRKEVSHFINKFDLNICTGSLNDLVDELSDSIDNSIEPIILGDEETSKEDIISLLLDLLSITYDQANYFASKIVKNLKVLLDDNSNFKLTESYVVLPNKVHNKRGGIIKDVDDNEEVNLNWYTDKIAEQIKEWMASLGNIKFSCGYERVVVNDLASDIVDRYKYHKLNPSSKGTYKEELKHLKYQIFRWFNRLVGVNDIKITDHAGDLMRRIQNVPVPLLTYECSGSKSSDFQYDKPGSSRDPEYIGYDFYPPGRIIRSDINIKVDQATEPIVPTNEYNPRYKFTAGIKIKDDSDNEKEPKKFKASTVRTVFTSMTEIPNAAAKGKRYSGPPNVSLTITGKAMQDLKQFQANACCKPGEPKTNTNNNTINNIKCNNQNGTPCCAVDANKSAHPNTDKLCEEYEKFLKDWVQKIPIEGCGNLTEKLRLGLYNGVLEAIAKLRMNPEAVLSPFYYQDVLDDEIEELLNCLPQTPELVSKRHALKASVVEKTAELNDALVKDSIPTSYKQQLVDNISNNLPIRNTVNHSGNDPVNAAEALLKLHLAEDFIMYTKYKEDDKIKANIYKKKIQNEVDEMIDNIKKSHGKNLQAMDPTAYVHIVIKALETVPVPTNETINREADEINFCSEIEQWSTDLPFVPNDVAVEQLSRRKHRDLLAKKLFDLEAATGNLEDNEDAARAEIKAYLKKMPLAPDQDKNEDFMTEELINRLKNRLRDVLAGSHGRAKRRSIVFIDPYNYDEFSKYMPGCSSFSEDPKNKAQVNESSYMIVGGERVDAKYPSTNPYVQRRNQTPPSDMEWFTLEESKKPTPRRESSVLRPLDQKQNKEQSCCQTQSPKQQQVQQEEQTKNDHPAVESPDSSNEQCSCAPRDSSRRLSQQPRPSKSEQAVCGAGNRRPSIPRQSDTQPGPAQATPSCGMTSCGGTQKSTYPYPDKATNETSKSKCCNATVGTKDDMSDYKDSSESPQEFCGNPIGYSTPMQKVSRPTSCRPRKRTKEIDKTKKDAARKRLVLDDTDSSECEGETKREKCRCMEKFFRCKMNRSCDPFEFNMDLMPCCPMAFPRYPCFY